MKKNSFEISIAYIVLVFFLVTSCGLPPAGFDYVSLRQGRTINYQVDEGLEYYLKAYEDATGRDVSDITLLFGKTGTESRPNVIGYCTFYDNRPAVVIDNSWWYYNNHYARELLVMHELGHCDLKRSHVDTVIMFNGEIIPESIMKSSIGYSDIKAYQKYKQYYIDELIREDAERILDWP
jgi:hypothetical protein